MDINICTTDVFNKFAPSLNDSLDTASEPGAPLGDIILWQFGKPSLHPGGQLLSDIAGSSVCVPFNCAPQIKVHQVKVRWVRRPDLRWGEVKEVVRDQPLRLSGGVSGCTILLQVKWPLSDGFLDPWLHHLLKDLQVDLLVHLQTQGKDLWGHLLGIGYKFVSPLCIRTPKMVPMSCHHL